MKPATTTLLLLLALGLQLSTARKLSASASGTYPDPALSDSYVQVIDGEFVLGCSTFPVSGVNLWEVLEAGAGVPSLTGSQLDPGVTGPTLLRNLFDVAADAGFTVIRSWAHGVTEQYAVQPKPGETVEGLLRGLDYALDEARKRGLKMILSFTSNWTPAGGVDSFANATGVSHNDFFTSSAPKEAFKSYVKTILTRTNTINGLSYAADPTIMAWNLINEPVCTGCAPGTIGRWVSEMAAYVKGLDKAHLVTVGEEGMWSTTGGSVGDNPEARSSSWAKEYTQDFVVDHAGDNIDFAAFHAWPDLWVCKAGCGPQPVSFLEDWINAHIRDAATLGKPLILEEFGKKGGRDEYFKAAYQAVEQSLKSGGPLKGALFWQLYGEGQQASKGEGGGSGSFGVYSGDSAFKIAAANAAATHSYVKKVSTCSAKGPSPKGQNCPPGMEGSSCGIDINECARGTAGCGSGAQCINNDGGAKCVCPLGSSGDAKSKCNVDGSVLKSALDGFWHESAGQACDKGEDIPYPPEAPGWVEDPVGIFERDPNRKGLYGARVPVTPEECAVACMNADGCEGFTHNDATKGCFLKAGQCPTRNGCQEPELICKSVNDMGKEISVSCGKWSTYYLNEVRASSGSC